MSLEDFSCALAEICSHSPAAPGRPLRWTVIANPRAGGFTIHARWKKHRAILDEYVRRAQALPPRNGSGPSRTAGEFDRGGLLGSRGVVPTGGPGDAGKIAGALIDEIRAGPGADRHTGGAAAFHLIITAGGDGTSLEVLTALFHAPAMVRSQCAVLRLPLGTGNDGADAMELDRALEFLVSPTRIDHAGALRLTTAAPGKGPFLAFNILSVGLDAFVTHMTNKMKGRLPGDSYKLWVDLAALFYDKIYRVGPMDVRVLDGRGRELQAFRENILLLAVGESGRRSYGSNKKILPDDRNVCALRQMPLLRKLALKELFNTGAHVNKPEALLWNAGKVEFSGRYPILAQMDGETVLLQPGDFPAAIELTEKTIPILRLA
jgi:diacylglycerol kinase family enzyme